MLLGTLLSGGFEKSGVLLQPAVTWTIVLVIDGLVSFSYSLDGKSERKEPVGRHVATDGDSGSAGS